jgi:hypothetical protein
VVSFTFRPLYPQRKSPGTHSIGGWMGPITGMDDVEKRKFLTLPGFDLRPLGRPARSQSLYWLRVTYTSITYSWKLFFSYFILKRRFIRQYHNHLNRRAQAPVMQRDRGPMIHQPEILHGDGFYFVRINLYINIVEQDIKIGHKFFLLNSPDSLLCCNRPTQLNANR